MVMVQCSASFMLLAGTCHSLHDELVQSLQRPPSSSTAGTLYAAHDDAMTSIAAAQQRPFIAHCVQIWRHPQNRNYITYRTLPEKDQEDRSCNYEDTQLDECRQTCCSQYSAPLYRGRSYKSVASLRCPLLLSWWATDHMIVPMPTNGEQRYQRLTVLFTSI